MFSFIHIYIYIKVICQREASRFQRCLGGALLKKRLGTTALDKEQKYSKNTQACMHIFYYSTL